MSANTDLFVSSDDICDFSHQCLPDKHTKCHCGRKSSSSAGASVCLPSTSFSISDSCERTQSLQDLHHDPSQELAWALDSYDWRSIVSGSVIAKGWSSSKAVDLSQTSTLCYILDGTFASLSYGLTPSRTLRLTRHETEWLAHRAACHGPGPTHCYEAIRGLSSLCAGAISFTSVLSSGEGSCGCCWTSSRRLVCRGRGRCFGASAIEMLISTPRDSARKNRTPTLFQDYVACCGVSFNMIDSEEPQFEAWLLKPSWRH